MPDARRLEYYAANLFDTVELNASFYRWPSVASFQSWRRRLPEGFELTVKAPRTLTHAKRLYEPEQWIGWMKERLDILQDRLGVVLFQLPPDMERDDARLDYFLGALPHETPPSSSGLAASPSTRSPSIPSPSSRSPSSRSPSIPSPSIPSPPPVSSRRTPGSRPDPPLKWKVAVEFRHPSWHVDEVFKLLEQHGAAYVVMSGAKLPCILRVTADFAYVRFHGPDEQHLYGGSYDEASMRWWADRVQEWLAQGRDVYGYFNNDWEGHAVRNGQSLVAALEH